MPVKEVQPQKGPDRAARHKAANQANFLEAFARLGTVKEAVEYLGLDSSTPYKWAREDPDFDAAFEATRAGPVMSMLEAEAKRRALKGSDVLLIFLMKGGNPRRYRDNAHLLVGQDRENPFAGMPDAELTKQAAALLAKAAGPTK